MTQRNRAVLVESAFALALLSIATALVVSSLPTRWSVVAVLLLLRALWGFRRAYHYAVGIENPANWSDDDNIESTAW